VKRKPVIWGIVIIIFAAAIILVRFVAGGDEDNWICQNGAWVAHGHPSAPMPTSACN